jgi:hypothetical protein
MVGGEKSLLILYASMGGFCVWFLALNHIIVKVKHPIPKDKTPLP